MVILWSIQIHYFALYLRKVPFECLKARRDLFQAFDDNTRRFLNVAFLILEMGIFLNFFSPRVVKELNLWKRRLSICYYKSLGQRRGLKFLCPLMTSRLPYRRLKQLSSMFPPEIKLLFRKHFLWFWLWNFLTYCANAIWQFPGNEICQVIGFLTSLWLTGHRKQFQQVVILGTESHNIWSHYAELLSLQLCLLSGTPRKLSINYKMKFIERCVEVVNIFEKAHFFNPTFIFHSNPDSDQKSLFDLYWCSFLVSELPVLFFPLISLDLCLSNSRYVVIYRKNADWGVLRKWNL